ncbi:MAG: hypothetical protein AAF871_03355 [Pseudomonadota bacterium]
MGRSYGRGGVASTKREPVRASRWFRPAGVTGQYSTHPLERVCLCYRLPMPQSPLRLFLLSIVLAAWVMIYLWSYLGLPDEAVTDGLQDPDRLEHFLGFQGVAGCLAVTAFGLARTWPKGAPLKSVAALPLLAVLAAALPLVVKI